MNESEKLSSELHDIKQMMERSSRFISLSGLSGIAAGVCALVGAWFAGDVVNKTSRLADFKETLATNENGISIREYMGHPLMHRKQQKQIPRSLAAASESG